MTPEQLAGVRAALNALRILLRFGATDAERDAAGIDLTAACIAITRVAR